MDFEGLTIAIKWLIIGVAIGFFWNPVINFAHVVVREVSYIWNNWSAK